MRRSWLLSSSDSFVYCCARRRDPHAEHQAPLKRTADQVAWRRLSAAQPKPAIDSFLISRESPKPSANPSKTAGRPAASPAKMAVPPQNDLRRLHLLLLPPPPPPPPPPLLHWHELQRDRLKPTHAAGAGPAQLIMARAELRHPMAVDQRAAGLEGGVTAPPYIAGRPPAHRRATRARLAESARKRTRRHCHRGPICLSASPFAAAAAAGRSGPGLLCRIVPVVTGQHCVRPKLPALCPPSPRRRPSRECARRLLCPLRDSRGVRLPLPRWPGPATAAEQPRTLVGRGGQAEAAATEIRMYPSRHGPLGWGPCSVSRCIRAGIEPLAGQAPAAVDQPPTRR